MHVALRIEFTLAETIDNSGKGKRGHKKWSQPRMTQILVTNTGGPLKGGGGVASNG